ncbi:MAG: TonB-dependent receptor [Lewinellaceae bacterium]|nr:TonB-dependent receptor [Lewinellaceae bacterium]
MKLKVDYMKRWVFFIAAVAMCNFAFAQRTITGTVTDAQNGDPLIGANILVVGTSTGTITDFDGNYSLNVSDAATTLEFSYTGYTSQRVEIGSQTVINVSLSAGQVLDEVVVVGYGTQKSKEVTSAVASIKAEDFNQGNVNSPAQLLQGKVAGLSIARPGGDPNGDFNIRLRGLSTVGANTEPLVIIDGVIGASLNSVDPNDIASIDVLKDGSAASIYGTRGSSGVILITTKQGKEGSAKVEYSGQLALETVDETVNVLDAAGYRDFSQRVGKGTDLGSSTDWFGELTETGVSQVHNLSLSGGTAKTTYRVALNYRNVNGVASGTGFNQLNGRLNLTQRAFDDRMRLSANVAATNRDADLGFTQAFRYATIYNPTAPIRDPDNTALGGYFQQDLFDYFNPVAIIEQNSNEQVQKRLILNGSIEYDLLPGLTAKMAYSEQYDNDLNDTYFSRESFWVGAGRDGLALLKTTDRFNRLFEFTGNYEKNFNKLNFKALAGYSYQAFDNQEFEIQGGGFLTDAFTTNNIISGAEFPNGLSRNYSYRESNKLIAFFGRVNFNYDDTYFLSASLRREGSSRFGENNKWGLFPGVSGGVTLSNLFNISGVDNLKLRAGFGVTGNNVFDSYLSLSRFGPVLQGGSGGALANDPRRGGNPVYFLYNGNYVPAFGPISNPNPDLKWETKTDISVGLDFALLDYKLTGALDFYTTTTKDMIFEFNVPVPPNLFATSIVNVGELQNSGLELSLNYNVISKQNFNWETGVALTYFLKTDLVSLSTDDFDFGGTRDISNLGAPGQNGTPLIRVEEGAPIGQIWGLVYEGISGDGQWIHADLNNDGEITNDDRAVIGNGLPDFQLGWSNTFKAGNFDFNIFLRGVFGHDLVNTFRAFYEAPDAITSYNILESSNDIANLTESPTFSSFHVEDASFVKVDNATVGYTFRLPEGSSFSNFRVYVTGQNLLTFTGYKGVDPEVRFQDAGNIDSNAFRINDLPSALAPGIDRRNTYFRTRVVTLGVNLGF